MDVETKKGRRLFEIKVKAIALVDRPAIMRKFLLLKRAVEMGKETAVKTISELMKQATASLQAVHEECMKRKEEGTAPSIDQDEQEEKKRAEEGSLDAIDFMTNEEWQEFQDTVTKSFHGMFGPFRFERSAHEDEDEESGKKKPKGIRNPTIPFEAKKSVKTDDETDTEEDIPEEVVEAVAGLCNDLVELVTKD